MRRWMLTIIGGAAVALSFAPDPAAAAWGWRGGWGWGGPRFAIGTFYHPYPYRRAYGYYGHPYAYYGSAYGYYGAPYRYYGYRSRYDCLGGRDSAGIPC
jgi:hypothetical protein